MYLDPLGLNVELLPGIYSTRGVSCLSLLKFRGYDSDPWMEFFVGVHFWCSSFQAAKIPDKWMIATQESLFLGVFKFRKLPKKVLKNGVDEEMCGPCSERLKG